MDIMTYIEMHWTEWLFALILAFLTYGYKLIIDRLKAEQERNKAIGEGVQALLRDSIVSNYNRYSEKKFCPVYARESVKRAYKAYHELGGNDVATDLYHKLLEMPTERIDQT